MRLSILLEKIEYSGNCPAYDVESITNDSRNANESSIFVCIKGFKTDGHLFAKSAYDNGCRVFICEREIDLPSDAFTVTVPNTRRALALLSSALYGDPSRELIVIGITGTKGKTTTALMIKQLLDNVGIPTGYIGSNGVIFGARKIETPNTTPESHILARYLRDMADSGMRAAVMEISSQALKLDRVLGINFDIALFTNFSPDHIGPDEHPDIEDYFLSKKKLFDKYGASTVIANADDEMSEKILADCDAEKIFYSVDTPAFFRAEELSLLSSDKALGTSFICREGNERFACSLSIPGVFNVHNALAAIAVARKLGIEQEKIASALESINIEGRFETLISPSGARFVIDYAHNGLSLKSALCALREYQPRRLICLFGSVGCRTRLRRTQLGEVAAEFADFSILTSDNPDTENPIQIINEIALCFDNEESYIAIPDRKDAICFAFDIARNGDIVLLAGKGHERYQLIGGKKLPFSEKEIIMDLINKVRMTK